MSSPTKNLKLKTHVIIMKRILKRVAIAIGGCLALLLVVGAVWEQVERRKVAAAYPAPGRLVDIGGRRIQIECRGTGSPTVVLETGLDYFGELAWAKVYDRLAEITRTCAYSRAGIVWSDDKPGPHDGLGVVHDLHATLAAAGEKGPFVMVGLSLGGPYSTIYTGLYGDQVAGLVYVDASHPDQLKRFEAALGTKPDGGMKSAIQAAGKWVSWTGIPRLVALRSRNSKSETMATVPPKAREIALDFFSTSLGPMVSERESMPATLDEAGAYRNLGARPVVVLTHGLPMPDMFGAESEKFERAWLELQKDMATWSSHGMQRTISDSHHYIPNDDPDAVIAAIREVVDDVRSAK
jgi:pimeloyl-ACP methyl ester carboxylesterase